MEPETGLVSTSGNQSTALAPVGEGQDAGFDLLVVFHLADQEYGLFASSVREIIRRRPTTRVPNSAAIIEGVINLRGSIIPVFNLRKCLDSTHVEDGEGINQIVMVVEVNDTAAGLLVDQVSDVVKISEKEIDRTSQKVEAGSSKQIIEGTVKLPGRLITLLSLASMLETQSSKKTN